MTRTIGALISDEDGAVTVDWVVLTASVVGMVILIYPVISPAITGMAEFIAERISKYHFFLEE
jgi:Flp pilus assembly pilin Flp